MAAYSSKLFNYDSASRIFTAEASQLGPVGRSIFHQIYKDACDAGITIISDRTGAEADYYIWDREVDQEGGVLSWKLLPTWHTTKKHPGTMWTIVIILND